MREADDGSNDAGDVSEQALRDIGAPDAEHDAALREMTPRNFGDRAAGEAARREKMPRNFGDPAAEYEAARSDVVVIDRTDRSFIRVHGRDPVKMVQGLVSNDVANAPAGSAVYATVLTPKGKMVADVRVLRHGADLLLETDEAAAEPLMAHLRKFVPPLFARFESADDRWASLGVYGPRSRELLTAVLGIAIAESPAEDDAYSLRFDEEDAFAVATAYVGVPGFDLVLPAARLGNVREALIRAGARRAGLATLDVLRIEAGSPRWGVELTDTTIPLEAGLRARAISETKGCYTGQEVIIRILHRGHVNWLLRRILLGDVATPARDATLIGSGGKKVGRVTSAAWSPKYGQTIGLGYVRREVEAGSEVRLGAEDGPVVTVVATTSDLEPVIRNGALRHGNAG